MLAVLLAAAREAAGLEAMFSEEWLVCEFVEFAGEWGATKSIGEFEWGKRD